MDTTTLSPEARNLIERTIDWLTPKGRWAKTWAKFRVNGREIEIDEADALYDRNFRELENWDEETGDYTYPLEGYKGDPQASCLVGSLIINNGYKNDKVFEEAVLFLEKLTSKSQERDTWCDRRAGYSDCNCRECEEYEPDLEEAIENLVSYNDSEKYSHKRHVLNLFRKALKLA